MGYSLDDFEEVVSVLVDEAESADMPDKSRERIVDTAWYLLHMAKAVLEGERAWE